MFLNNLVHHRKSQSGAALERSEKRVENFVQLAFRYAATVVFDDYFHIVFMGFHGNGKTSTFFHGFNGVVAEIEDHLFQKMLVAQDFKGLRWGLEIKDDVLSFHFHLKQGQALL